MGFIKKIKVQALVACKRHCVLCEEQKGLNIECHHIKPEEQGGDNSFDNCIPLCFDCHAIVGSYNSKHPKGNMYSENELRIRRDNFYEKIALTSAPNSVNVEENLLILFNEALVKCDIISFVQADPFVIIRSDLPFKVDGFVDYIQKELIHKYISEQQSIIYQEINGFMRLVDEYNGYLSQLVYPVANGCFNIKTNFLSDKEINEIKRKIQGYKIEINEKYNAITNGKTLFI